jgi:hypothetical protein
MRKSAMTIWKQLPMDSDENPKEAFRDKFGK